MEDKNNDLEKKEEKIIKEDYGRVAKQILDIINKKSRDNDDDSR